MVKWYLELNKGKGNEKVKAEGIEDVIRWKRFGKD